MKRSGFDDRGFAVIGSAVIVALAIFMGFGAAVIIQRSSMLHQAKLSRQRIARKSHEFLKVTVDRNSNNTDVTLMNRGSAPSVADVLFLKSSDNSLEVKQKLGKKRGTIPVRVLGQKSFTIGENIGDSKAGVHTRLGNIFWED